MLKSYFWSLCSILLLLCSNATAQTNRKVIIIGLDGCRTDALHTANTPHLDSLITSGFFSPDALNDDITISGPGWSAILCGVWSDKHRVFNNNFGGNNYDSFPSIFRYIEELRPELHTVSICHWGPINDFIIQEEADFKLNVDTDQEVASITASYLQVNDPDVLFLHFDDPDAAGHAFGFSPDVPEYVQTIEQTDQHVGTVVQAIRQRPTYAEEDWLIVVTTDHGGIGTSHGGNSIEEQRIPFILHSLQLSPSVLTRDTLFIVDTVNNCLGDTLELSFDGENDHVEIPADSLYDFGADRDFTVECRLRTSFSGDVAIIGNKDWNSGTNKGFVFSFKFPSGPEWKVNIGDGSNRADLNNGGLIADGEWHTLSVSFDRDAWMKMYEDGRLLDSVDISGVGDISSGTGLFFGTDIFQNFDFTGSLAEVRIWDTVLDEAVIGDWYCQALDDAHPDYNQLVGNWKLNEGEGATVKDYSTFEKDGLISEAQWSHPDTMIRLDYTNTPRLTDVVPTALTHLCIPINSSWALDGQSLVQECVTTSTSGTLAGEKASTLWISPNPIQNRMIVELQSETYRFPIHAELYNTKGIKLFEQQSFSKRLEMNMAELAPGAYIVRVQNGNTWLSQKIIKN